MITFRNFINESLEPTDDNIKQVKQFVLKMWKERAKENNKSEPSDLTNACKFSSVFGQKIFGGKVEGNYHHQYNVLPDGTKLDLTDGAGGTQYKLYHDKKFYGNREHKQSLDSIQPRIEDWVKKFYSIHKGNQ